jgi:methyl-accepting chemotaxis protein
MRTIKRERVQNATSGRRGSFLLPAKERRKALSELNKAIRDLEGMRETVRNNRQMSSAAFRNFDRKANQQFDLLSSVMKAMTEMRLGVIQYML